MLDDDDEMLIKVLTKNKCPESLPEVATSSIPTFSLTEIKPSTLNTTKPAKKLLPQLIQLTTIASLQKR